VRDKKPVNVTWQIIMVFIPFAWIWAFYRIRKFWWQGVALYAVGFAIGFVIGGIAGLVEGMYEIYMYGDLLTGELSEGTENLATGISFLTASVVMVYFIRKWSIEWNEKIGTKNP